MGPKVRRAIEATILRWAEIAAAEDPRTVYLGTKCALCRIYQNRDCRDCPAGEFGFGCCHAFSEWGDTYHPRGPAVAALRLAACYVHDYAVSLLHQEED